MGTITEDDRVAPVITTTSRRHIGRGGGQYFTLTAAASGIAGSHLSMVYRHSRCHHHAVGRSHSATLTTATADGPQLLGPRHQSQRHR